MIFNDLLNPLLAAGSFLDPKELLRAFGYIGIVAIIFAESGLLIGFFLPGDSLLFTAGVLSSAAAGKVLGGDTTQPLFNIWLLCGLCFVAAIAGDSVGYWFGNKVGPRIFTKQDSLLFRKKNVEIAQNFYEKHGGKTIILARFIPIVRTFAPIVAGIGKMPYRTFLAYNVVGGFFWSVGVTFLGYLLGSAIPPEDVDKYLLPLIILIVLISVAPAAYHILKDKENRQQIMESTRKLLKREKSTAPEILASHQKEEVAASQPPVGVSQTSLKDRK